MSGGLNEQQADSLLNAYGGLLRRVSELEAERDQTRTVLANLASKADSTVSEVLAMTEDSTWPPVLGVMTSLDMAVIEAREFLARDGQQQGGGTA